MFAIKRIAVDHFRIPLPLALSDSTHGEITHFGLVTVRLTDAQGRVIAQGQDTPVHLGVMAFTVKEFLKVVSPEDLRPGDVYLTNLPEIGGNHLPDV